MAGFLVEIWSEIPEGDPHKGAFESAVRDLMCRVGGDWVVEILLTGTGSWWFVSASRAADGLRGAALLGPDDRTAEALEDRLGYLLAKPALRPRPPSRGALP